MAESIGRRIMSKYEPSVRAYSGKDYQRQVRYVNGMTILFYSKESIYVMKGINKIICNRWFNKSKGSYKSSWFPFQRYMKDKNIQSISEVIKVANAMEVNVQGCSRKFPEIDENVIVIKKGKK